MEIFTVLSFHIRNFLGSEFRIVMIIASNCILFSKCVFSMNIYVLFYVLISTPGSFCIERVRGPEPRTGMLLWFTVKVFLKFKRK
jgi:hypothetical protein